jgi:hypothetical protein
LKSSQQFFNQQCFWDILRGIFSALQLAIFLPQNKPFLLPQKKFALFALFFLNKPETQGYAFLLKERKTVSLHARFSSQQRDLVSSIVMSGVDGA